VGSPSTNQGANVLVWWCWFHPPASSLWGRGGQVLSPRGRMLPSFYRKGVSVSDSVTRLITRTQRYPAMLFWRGYGGVLLHDTSSCDPVSVKATVVIGDTSDLLLLLGDPTHL
jgi:hypothetical protein